MPSHFNVICNMAVSCQLKYLLLTFFLLCITITRVVSMPSSNACSACRYKAHNCSNNATEASIHVCDDQGHIQIDDVFCDGSSCKCTGDKLCASLIVGCQDSFQARSRRRCLSTSTLHSRFQSCASAFTSLTDSNLQDDWVHFKENDKCVSDDCQAVQQFDRCSVVQCGTIAVAWKESDAYHFIVQGTRRNDLATGTFHYKVQYDPAGYVRCESADSDSISPCFSMQTQNQKDGVCDSVYLELDTTLKLSNSNDYKLSKLSWPVWNLVVGCAGVAAVVVLLVAFVYYKHRKIDQDESQDALLDDDCDKQSKQTDDMDSPQVAAYQRRTHSSTS